VHDAYLGDPRVREFLLRENPEAARAIAERLEAARRKGLWHLRFMKIGGNPEAGVGGTASYRNSSAASASVNSEHS